MGDSKPGTPKFVTLEEAAAMKTGTRVTFFPGIPAFYSEARKNVCPVKGIPLTRQKRGIFSTCCKTPVVPGEDLL